MTSIQEIKDHLSALSEKDHNIALSLIEKRDFLTLKELVNSVVITTEMRKDKIISAKTVNEEECIAIYNQLDAVEKLQTFVAEYAAQFEDPNVYDLPYSEEDDAAFMDNLYFMYCAHKA